jgi:hypothetical protein
MKQLVITALTVAAVGFVSCNRNDDNLGGTFTSDQVNVGNGKAWSWIETAESGIPMSIGVTLTEDALTGLADTANHDHLSYEFTVPSTPFATPFKHITIDWNPQGHPPGFYMAPHFDFHFYTITSAERHTIPAYAEDSNSFKQFPAPAYLPVGYINPGGGEAEMGAHWVDVMSPELNGLPFTQTIIYGTYKGKVNFLEPMITHEFLTDTASFQRNIPRPAKVMETGYYPTIMRLTHSSGVYKLSMEGMEWREKS